MEKEIKNRLIENFAPEFLEVKNNSHLHQGHSGDNGTGNSHFSITIKSKKFNGLTRISAHRMVNEVMKSEFEKSLHALEIKILR